MQAYQSNVLKLSELAKFYKQDLPLLTIEAMIIVLNDFVNVREEGKMSDRQIQETARLLYSDFYFYNLAELTLVFNRLKTGHYGSFFGRVDGVEILRAFREYRKERGDAVLKAETPDPMPLMDRAKGILKLLDTNPKE